MKLTPKLAAVTILCMMATGAKAAEYEISQSYQTAQSTAEVWRVIGDFCDIDDWHPDISDCTLKVMDGSLHRVLKTGDGGEIVEKRIASEAGLSYTYRITQSPLAVENFTATLAVEPRDGALVTWIARFSSDDPAMEGRVANLVEAGVSGIEKALK